MPRKPRPTLQNWLNDARQGVYLIGADGHLAYLNTAMAQWLGGDPAAWLGRSCQFAAFPADGLTEGQLAGLAPPPDLPLDAPSTSIVVARGTGGPLRTARATFFPLASPGDAAPVWWVWVACEAPVPSLPPLDDATAEKLLSPSGLRTMAAHWFQQALGCGASVAQMPGVSPEADRIRRAAQWIAASGADVLIWGPPGAGRQTLARTIAMDQGAPPPLVIDCPTIEPETLQRVMARACREIPTRERHILLRHVDQLSGESAAELKGFLQLPDREVRLLATATRPLLELSAAARFDADLANRLSAATIEIPPLRTRPLDVAVLAQWVLERLRETDSFPARTLAASVLQMFSEYTWPGELAELEQTVRHAAAASRQAQVLPGDLPDRFRFAWQAMQSPHWQPATIELDDYLADIERRLMERALSQAKWNRAQAARALSISRARLIRRAEQLGIRFPADEIPFEEIDDGQ